MTENPPGPVATTEAASEREAASIRSRGNIMRHPFFGKATEIAALAVALVVLLPTSAHAMIWQLLSTPPRPPFNDPGIEVQNGYFFDPTSGKVTATIYETGQPIEIVPPNRVGGVRPRTAYFKLDSRYYPMSGKAQAYPNFVVAYGAVASNCRRANGQPLQTTTANLAIANGALLIPIAGQTSQKCDFTFCVLAFETAGRDAICAGEVAAPVWDVIFGDGFGN